MTKYEHRIEELTDGNLIGLMNRMSAEGWEYIPVPDRLLSGHALMFRREDRSGYRTFNQIVADMTRPRDDSKRTEQYLAEKAKQDANPYVRAFRILNDGRPWWIKDCDIRDELIKGGVLRDNPSEIQGLYNRLQMSQFIEVKPSGAHAGLLYRIRPATPPVLYWLNDEPAFKKRKLPGEL